MVGLSAVIALSMTWFIAAGLSVAPPLVHHWLRIQVEPGRFRLLS